MVHEILTAHDILTVLSNDPDFDDWGQYGDVNTKTEGDYILFNYSAEAQYNRRWNNFERMSRGLIVDKTLLKVVARPFDKFFNWGELGEIPDTKIDYVMQKMDGSLGICWYDHYLKDWRITTRGSFDSEQAQWATERLHTKHGEYLDLLNKHTTYLFEIIYPENRIVVDYGDYQSLVFLGARYNGTGKHTSMGFLEELAVRIKVPCVQHFRHAGFTPSPETLYRKLENTKGTEVEGFVAVMEDGSRWKFKSEDYLRIHKIISNFSFKHTLEALATRTFPKYVEGVPDEFLEQIKIWRDGIRKELKLVKAEIQEAVFLVGNLRTRKEKAEVILRDYKDIAHFVFRALDGKLDDSFIYQKHDWSNLE